MQAIFERRAAEGKSQHSQSLHNIKDGANMFNFIQRREIRDMAGLDDCFGNMIGKQQDIRDKLKPIDRRLKTLDEHIRHSGNYKTYRGKKAQYQKLYAQYETIKKAGGFGAERKAHKALAAANEYYETNRNEITMYDKADQYLKGVLQEHFDPKKLPPVTKWNAERGKLTAERKMLDADYYKLKDEVKEAEQIRKSVYSIMRQEQRELQPRRARDMER
jgi:RNA polymerase-interacting CarD/CdnL/TRCF family regulator